MLFSRKKKPDGGISDEVKLAALCSKPVRYVSLRDGVSPTESVIGRSGHINLADGRVMICCGAKVVFDMPLDALTVGELLSKNGVTFTFTEDGTKKTVIAYYSYYIREQDTK